MIPVEEKTNLLDLNLFRFRKIKDKYLITNDLGHFAFLTETELIQLTDGSLSPGTPLYKSLSDKGFVETSANASKHSEQLNKRLSFLKSGTGLHIIIITLRCNEICAYCQASRADMKKTEYDMDIPTAEHIVDFIFQSPADSITIEFQGGEPLANFDTLKRVLEYSLEKNRTHNKRLMFSLVTNLSLMDEEKFKYLTGNKVQICTSLDGPEKLHNSLRKLKEGSAYKKSVEWMRKINHAYHEMGLDPNVYHVEALLTVTRESLVHYRDIVDEYVSHGLKAIFLRPLQPYGYAKNTVNKIGYSGKDFLDFYVKNLDYIIELNRKGVEILERTAAIFLVKILSEYDPNFLDLRSPCGAGIGQLAYNYDGNIFTCDEGRMLYQMGDDSFMIGNVKNSSYSDVVFHETVRAISVASCLDCIPGCSDCAFKPYCGVCPVYNYAEQGNIFGIMSSNEKCVIQRGIMDYLFSLLEKNDPVIIDIFNKWISLRDRSAFYH
jgi:His-Xaa-Ser system radical SAM maturase HxsB